MNLLIQGYKPIFDRTSIIDTLGPFSAFASFYLSSNAKNEGSHLLRFLAAAELSLTAGRLAADAWSFVLNSFSSEFFANLNKLKEI